MEYYDFKKNDVGSGRRYELSSHQVTNHQMHAYTTKRMYTHTHTHTQKHAHKNTCKHSLTHTYTHTETHTHTHTLHARTHACMYTYTHIYSHTHSHAHTHAHTNTHTHTHTHTHAHAHTHTHTHITYDIHRCKSSPPPSYTCSHATPPLHPASSGHSPQSRRCGSLADHAPSCCTHPSHGGLVTEKQTSLVTKCCPHTNRTW